MRLSVNNVTAVKMKGRNVMTALNCRMIRTRMQIANVADTYVPRQELIQVPESQFLKWTFAASAAWPLSGISTPYLDNRGGCSFCIFYISDLAACVLKGNKEARIDERNDRLKI